MLTEAPRVGIALVPLAGLQTVLGDPEDGILARLIRTGRIAAPDADGRVDLTVVVPNFFEELRAQMRAGTASAASERARGARAEAHELRLAEARRDLVSQEEATIAVEHLASAIIEVMSGLPARINRDLAVRRQVEDLVRKAQTAMADDLDPSPSPTRKALEKT